MAVLQTQVNFTLVTTTLTLTHALGTTPDYIVFEHIGVSTLTGAIVQPITATATNFYVIGSADTKTPYRATVVKTHSIQL